MAYRFEGTATTMSATSIRSDALSETTQTTTMNTASITTSGQITPDVAKVECQKFLSTLLRLASEHPGVAMNIKLLIQGLIDSILEPEEFTHKIQHVLNNSSPQPGLIRFLKMSLPYLRHSLTTRELVIQGITPPNNLNASNTVAGQQDIPNEVPQQNFKDVEMIDISEEKDERMNCLCDDRQSSGLTIICGKCQSWFHCSCVGISEAIRNRLERMEAQWFCPRCFTHKEFPTMLYRGEFIQGDNMDDAKLPTSSSLPPENSFNEPQLTSNMAHTAETPKDDSLSENGQDVTSLVCRHCPFRSNSRQILDFHEYLHSAISPFKCFFCTFTVESTSLMLDHIQLGHPEKEKVYLATYTNRRKKSSSASPPEKEASLAEVNKEVALAPMTNHEMNGSVVEPSVIKGVPSETSRWDQTIKEANEVEMIDVTKEINGDGSATAPKNESKLWCICRQPVEENCMVRCDGCKYWFHGSCVGITPAKNRQTDADGGKWLCPHCIRKDSIINHHSKVIQAMTNLSTEFQATSFQNSLPPESLSTKSPEDGDLDDDSDDPPNLNSDLSYADAEAPSAPPDLQSDRETLYKEEIICRMEMEKLTEDIRAGHEALVKKANDLKEEEGPAMPMSLTRKTDELRRNINELEMKDRGESLERTVLIEFKERAQLRLKEFISQKIQLEMELNPLKEVPSINKKIKLEFPTSNSSEISELIQRKETILEDVKVQLADALKEENDYIARIRVMEEELAENARKLAQLQDELNSLKDNPAGGLPSANFIQMKTLKMEQRVRIAELSRLEKRLVQISCGFVLDEISRKEEEWEKAVDDYD